MKRKRTPISSSSQRKQSYSPTAPNVSSSSEAHGTQTECDVSKSKIIKCAKRTYFDNLSMSFTQDGDKTSPRPKFILCNEVLQNNSTEPFKLKHHFETKNSKHKLKPR